MGEFLQLCTTKYFNPIFFKTSLLLTVNNIISEGRVFCDVSVCSNRKRRLNRTDKGKSAPFSLQHKKDRGCHSAKRHKHN